MTSSIARPRANIWVRMVWAVGLYLALELGLFVIIGQILHATVRALAGPYLAFAAPGAILLPLAWGLRTWEERGPSPRHVALGWGLCLALFTSALAVALVYACVEFHLVNPSDVWILVAACVAGVLLTSFNMYGMALARISARAARNTHGA